MGTACPAKDIAKHRPRATPSTDSTRSGIHPCPAYRFCREIKKSYGLPDQQRKEIDLQQITALHDLLQAIKEAAVRLARLIDINERRQDTTDFRYERNHREDNPGSSEIILATTSSSVCALCGIPLCPKISTGELTYDGEETNAYTRASDITSSDLGNVFYQIRSHEAASPVKIDKKQEKIIPTSRSTDSSSGSDLRSKLLFVRRISADKVAREICPDERPRRHDNPNLKYVASVRGCKADETLKPIKLTQQSPRRIPPTSPPTQDASTLTHEMLCPCACGLLTKEIESEVSIEPLPMPKEKLIKTKLEELRLHFDLEKTTRRKTRDAAAGRSGRTAKQKLEKRVNTEYWKQEVMQLRLQTQVEELHRNIRFFKQENEYIRCLVEQCRYSSEKTKVLQQLLPITYSGFATAIQHLRAQFRTKQGIITTLTEMLRGSLNIQQIAGKLLAFVEYWCRDSDNSITTAHVSSASGTELLPPTSSSSTVFDVY